MAKKFKDMTVAELVRAYDSEAASSNWGTATTILGLLDNVDVNGALNNLGTEFDSKKKPINEAITRINAELTAEEEKLEAVEGDFVDRRAKITGLSDWIDRQRRRVQGAKRDTESQRVQGSDLHKIDPKNLSKKGGETQVSTPTPKGDGGALADKAPADAAEAVVGPADPNPEPTGDGKGNDDAG